MPYFIGVTLALAIGAMATALRMDRDRAFYPTVMMVVASYYVLFAAQAASTQALLPELAAGAVFLAMAVVGFRTSLWLVAFALVAHGAFDAVHGHVIDNPGMPAWWPAFCAAYDVVAGVYLAWLLRSGRVSARIGHGDR